MAKIDGGYIVLARKIMGNSSWQGLNEAGKIVMITLLMLANHKDRKWYNPLTKGEVFIKRGQCITGRKSLADQCGIGEQSVRTALTLLKSTNFLTIEPTSRFSIITICNYEHYQNPKNYINQVSDQESNQVLTKSQPSPNHKQELKNDKNEIINTISKDFFDYFLLKTKKAFKLTPERVKLIESRIKDGFTYEQLRQAVDNFVQDDWEGRAKLMDLVYCIGIRNKIDNLEKWLNYKPKEPQARKP